MPLDPVIAALIAGAALQTPVREMTPQQARNRQPPFRADLMPYASTGPVEDIELEGEGGRFSVRQYSPAARPGPLPLILYFHGGGFVVGDLDTHDAIARNLCGGAGVAVVSVGYRLAPEYPFPTAVDDAVASLRWAIEQAGMRGWDADRMVVCGDSAGGALAAVCAITTRDLGIQLRGQVLNYPVTAHPSAGHTSYEAFADGYGLSRADMEWYWRQYIGSDTRPTDPRADLFLHPDLADVAPAFIATAEYDTLRDEGEAYARRLQEFGVRVLVRRYAGMNHGFWARSGSVATAAGLYDDIFAWLAERLG